MAEIELPETGSIFSYKKREIKEKAPPTDNLHKWDFVMCRPPGQSDKDFDSRDNKYL